MRSITGETAVRLGDGQAFAVSPDGKTALTMSVGSPPVIALLPLGAGEPTRITNDEFSNYEAMDWMPDGRRFVFAGSAPDRAVRCYIQEVDGGEPQPITPAGYHFSLGQKAVSPNGEWIVAQADGPPALFPVGGGERSEIPGLTPDDSVLAWSADGRSVFVTTDRGVPQRVERVGVSTGERTLWKHLAPADVVGVFDVWSIQISHDEESYCYTYGQNVSDLF